MVRREDIVKGAYLRTLSDALSIPSGRFATVETVGKTWQGEFVFAVRWLNWKTGTQARPISDRSLNLWEQDLTHFEAVQEQDISSQATVPLPSLQPKLALQADGHRNFSKRKRADIDQLNLFTLDAF
jgi:hypothetical protein